MATQAADWLWNPYQTLELHSLGGQFFCVGSSRSKGNSRCRLSIHYTKQLKAKEILNAMAVQKPSSEAVITALRELVFLLLCPEWHQNYAEQKEARVSDWSAKIQYIAVEFMEKQRMISQIQQLEADLSRYKERSREEGKEVPNNELREQLERVQQERDKAQRKTREWNTLYKASASTVADLQAKLQEAQGQLESFQALQTSTSTRIKTLEGNLDTKKTELQQVQHELREKETILQNRVSAATKTSALQRELESTKANLQETRSELKESKGAFEVYQSGASSKIRELNTALEAAKLQTSTSSSVSSNLEAQLQEAENKTATYDRKLDAFKNGSIKFGAFVIYATRRSRI
ncbi:hypothetical protein MMC29_004492, partial [Sticta canariensis]|nr:hypothetical protein [Sticta canariensis]